MPQLNPSPWFLILVFTWFVFFSFLPFKVLNHSFLNSPLALAINELKAKTWNWQWQ